jgi:pimeloyl-ACP methyl ester carboxylesterase
VESVSGAVFWPLLVTEHFRLALPAPDVILRLLPTPKDPHLIFPRASSPRPEFQGGFCMLARILFLASMLIPIAADAATPCTAASQTCTEWVALGGGPARSLIYRTYPLEARNESITGALVMIHGAGRDADNYFRTALAAAFLAGTLENTVVISPRFASNSGNAGGGCADKLDTNEINWPCGGNSWRSGGVAAGSKELTSFDFVDEILRKLARKEIFPKLKQIVVAGHSAGGQFVNRYEMANQVHDQLGIPVIYVVSNPSSYAYLDDARPTDAAYTVSARAPGYVPAQSEDGPGDSIAGSRGGLFRSQRDGRGCTIYDQWPYGLKNRTGYTARLTDDQLKQQLAARPAIYLLGELDILPLGGFDSSCAAMAQGPTRLARGQAFSKYANEKFGAHHTMTVVPLCGHNARCMFTSEVALRLIFPQK